MTLFQKLDEIRGQILESTKLDESFEDLQDKISTFLAQFAIQAGLNSTLKLVQENNSLLVRRITFDLKKLAERGEPSESRGRRCKG